MAKIKRILLSGLDGEKKLGIVSKCGRILIELGKRDPEIRELAVRIVSSCKGKDYRCEAETLHRWVQDNIRYVKDPMGVERFATANRTFQERAGDCDDSSIALSALLESIGHETRLILIDGDLSGKFTHVISQVKLSNTWHWMETTKKVPFGWAPHFTVSHIIDSESVGEKDMENLDNIFGTDVGDLGSLGRSDRSRRRSKLRPIGVPAGGGRVTYGRTVYDVWQSNGKWVAMRAGRIGDVVRVWDGSSWVSTGKGKNAFPREGLGQIVVES